MYKAQKAIAGRLAVSDSQVAALLDALAAGPGTRLAKEAAAVVLQVAPARMDGAVAQLQKLLNVEGYGVLRVDGSMLVLDARLLREQFGVTDRG
jgi:peptidoglycan hydrolase-like protein with peptidoglycan-binding domain